MFSLGRPTLSNDLQLMSNDITKVGRSLHDFVTQLQPLQYALQADTVLKRFSSELDDVIIFLTDLHQRFNKLIQRSREVAGEVQARLADFEYVIKPGLCDPSIQWSAKKTEVDSCIQDISDQEAAINEIADGFLILHKDVQERAAKCGRLHAELNADLKSVHRRNLDNYLKSLKECAMKLPSMIPDLLQCVAGDPVIGSIIVLIINLMSIAVPIAKHSVVFFWNKWRVSKEGARLHIVLTSEWEEQCANAASDAQGIHTTRHAWHQVRKEMQLLRNALTEVTEEHVVPVVDSYVDVIRSLRHTQMVVV